VSTFEQTTVNEMSDLPFTRLLTVPETAGNEGIGLVVLHWVLFGAIHLFGLWPARIVILRVRQLSREDLPIQGMGEPIRDWEEFVARAQVRGAVSPKVERSCVTSI
jgi:hypothetical protein